MTTYLITGIGRGIGEALSLALLARGDRVVGTVRNREGLPAELKAHEAAGRLRVLAMDVRDGTSVAAAAASLDEPVDVLVNNAGIIGPQRQAALDMDFEGFIETLQVNTLAPLRVAQAFLPHLRRSKNTRIVTISSRMGSLSHAKSDHIAYRASKAAVNKVMQALATDLEGEGIPVIMIHPGWVRTDMGGSGADISGKESASGIVALIDRLSLEETGGFFNWQGEREAF